MADLRLKPKTDYDSMLEAALDYVRMGCEVIPSYSPRMFSKRGNTTWRKHIAGSTGKCPLRLQFYFKGLRTEKEVRYWFERYPHANLDIKTGMQSGFVVLDVDFYKDYKLPAEGLPETLRASTGNGEHYYFLHPGEGIILPPFNNNIAGNLNLIADGGNVTAPPSLHSRGIKYQWINPETPLAPLPPFLLQEARKQTKAVTLKTIIWRYYYHVLLLFPKYFVFFWLRDCWDWIKKSEK